MIDSTDRREWAQHPVTQEFVLELKKYREEILEKIGQEHVVDHDRLQRFIGRATASKVFLDAIESLTEESKKESEEEAKNAESLSK